MQLVLNQEYSELCDLFYSITRLNHMVGVYGKSIDWEMFDI